MTPTRTALSLVAMLRKAAPKFELVEPEDIYGNAFDREVSARLL